MSLFWHPNPRAYTDSVIQKHPSKYFRARLLYDRAWYAFGSSDTSTFLETLASLQNNYFDSKWFLKAQSLNQPVLSVGEQVPTFQFRSIDDTLLSLSPDSLKGRCYLMDFWATWCGGCIQEMPTLHQVYEKYREQGFTIVSVSFDYSTRSIKAYRHGKWKMPWFNACVGSNFGSPAVAAFGVKFIPIPFLIGSDGTIVAMGSDLRGEGLEQTVAKYLGR